MFVDLWPQQSSSGCIILDTNKSGITASKMQADWRLIKIDLFWQWAILLCFGERNAWKFKFWSQSSLVFTLIPLSTLIQLLMFFIYFQLIKVDFKNSQVSFDWLPFSNRTKKAWQIWFYLWSIRSSYNQSCFMLFECFFYVCIDIHWGIGKI